MFCRQCTNSDLEGNCLNKKAFDKCNSQTLQEKLDRIFTPELVKALKECGELPSNFKKFGVKANRDIRDIIGIY